MLFFVLIGIGLLGGIAVVAAGRGDGLSSAPVDRAPIALPAERPLARADVDRLTFSVGLRGYRMDEVDDVLDRLATDLEQRDLEIAVLRAQSGRAPEGPAGGPAYRGAHAGPVQGAAFTRPEQLNSDPETERTLFVPLDPEAGPDA